MTEALRSQEPTRRRHAARVLALSALLGLPAALWSSDAEAYCFSTTCRESPACDGEAVPGCQPLRWFSRCAGFSVQEDGGAGVGAKALELLTELAFEAWTNVDCGDGRGPGIVVQNLGRIPCEKTQYNKDAGNANVIVVRAERWPHINASHNIALTTTTFDPETGELLDADIEVNAEQYLFSITDEQVEYDLLSVLTHEAGHFLGLAHSDDVDATMFATYDGGTTTLRSPEPDDIASICSLYPPKDSLSNACNPLQRHGFSPFCRDDQPEGGCSLVGIRVGGPSDDRSAGSRWWIAAGLLLWAGLKRRRT